MGRKRSPQESPEHDSNTQPSNKGKHEAGKRRKLLAKGKDKKRQKPGWFQR